VVDAAAASLMYEPEAIDGELVKLGGDDEDSTGAVDEFFAELGA
jgi:hypothetical protein